MKRRRIKLPPPLLRCVSALVVIALTSVELEQASGQSAPTITTTHISPEKLQLNWTGNSISYYIQTTPSLVAPNWTTLLATARTNAGISLGAGSGFYRILSEKTNTPTVLETVSNVVTGDVFTFNLQPHSAGGNWVLTSTTNWNGANSVHINIAQSNLENTDVKFDSAGGFTVVDTNGVSLGMGGYLTSSPGPGPNDVSFSGYVTNANGMATFSGVSDWLMIVAIVGAMAVLACAALVAVTCVLACAAQSISCTLQGKKFSITWPWVPFVSTNGVICQCQCSCD